MRQTELAWAAGFFDGEGTTSIQRDGNGDHPKAYQGLRVTISQSTDRRVLDRFKEAVGVGKVYGPYTRAGRAPFFSYYAGGEDADLALTRIWPYLGEVKKDQAEDTYAKLLSHHEALLAVTP